ncbi:hypothetical protein IZ6_22610 [Terrihabitans soli]|uniref:Peptidoglycan-binding protein n=1 Tax=Terrihabitans soli TaxID=708113 RepID=A0A6S6QPV1_9HYPH|nr:M15 family metallopeptidase [Terrihabitans soli]BCJ91526.1 hypothetical protein IZ6_22610 [Terrihabitans soli]
MAILLSRGGNNVPAEVQRWQHFLLSRNIPQAGSIDADFGLNTQNATKIFQLEMGVPVTGALDAATHAAAVTRGYRDISMDFYSARAGKHWPPPPSFNTPSNAARNSAFGCFMFSLQPEGPRPDHETIVIGGSCDGAQRDWVAANIVTIDVTQLKFAAEYRGRFRCHRLIERKVKDLFGRWEAEGLLHLFLTYAGAYVSRYVRDTQLPKAGHGPKKSSAVTSLSNHAFGSAFDINATWNPRTKTPAPPDVTQRGSVRLLVPSANAVGFFWGGHYQAPTKFDGMHFEFADFSQL